MTHLEACKAGPQGRDNPKNIINYARGDSELVYIATALRTEGTYHCPDDNCRVEVVPRKGTKNVPFRHHGKEGLRDTRAHFAAKGENPLQGPRQGYISQHQAAIDMVVSLLEASNHYSNIYHTKEKGGMDLDVRYQREKDQWWKLAAYPVDIIARAAGIDMLVQIEEHELGRRYGNTDEFITRVNKIANPDHKFILHPSEGSNVELSNRIYQASVVLLNSEWYSEKDGSVVPTPTETVLLQGFFDQVYVLDLAAQELITPTFGVVDDSGIPVVVKEDRTDAFFFTEEHYGGVDWKRVEIPVANRDREVLIPHMRVAKAQEIAFDQKTGEPIPQDSVGQMSFSFE